MLKYALLLYGMFELSFALTSKCTSNYTPLQNNHEDIYYGNYYSRNTHYSNRLVECKDYNLQCSHLSEQEFGGSLSDFCFQTCYYDKHATSVCHQTRELKVISSSISQLTNTTFVNFVALTKLHMETCQIHNIDSSLFKTLPEITEIIFSDNILEDFTIKDSITLRKLYLNNNRLKNVHLSESTDLQYVDLANNSITTLQNCIINLTNLMTLNLTRNHLKEIAAKYFQEMDELIHLDLSNNEIQSIEAETFSKMRNLQSVYLGNNMLVELPGNIFSNNLFLKVISLSNNNLTDLTVDLFKGLRNLNSLELNNISISEITQEIFGNHSTNSVIVSIVRLDYNQLKKINFTMFDELKSKQVNVSHNRLQSLEIKQVSYNLDASFNEIKLLYDPTEMKKNITKPLPPANDVTYIRLDNNNIGNLKPGHFHKFTRLETLSLKNNQIIKLPYGVFDGLNNLINLNLDHNFIGSAHPAVFSDLQKLQTLILSNNNLQLFEMGKILYQLPILRVLDIDHNKWECDYLYKMLWSGFVKSHVNLTIKSEENLQRDPYVHSVNGIRCFDLTEMTADVILETTPQSFAIENLTTLPTNSIYVSTEASTSKTISTTMPTLIQETTSLPPVESIDSNIINRRLEDIIDRINKLDLKSSATNTEVKKEESAAISDYKHVISDTENGLRGQTAGIVILIILVLVIGLISLYNIYESKRWRERMLMYGMSTNTMVEDI